MFGFGHGEEWHDQSQEFDRQRLETQAQCDAGVEEDEETSADGEDDSLGVR